MRRRTWFGLALAVTLFSGVGATLFACNNTANNVAACQQIESARCTLAQQCGIDLNFPLHSGSSDQDNITACQLFYQDACLHGLVTTASVSSTVVTKCVSAITDVKVPGYCNTVLNPQTNPACSWLIPPDAGTDAADADTDVVTTSSGTTIIVVTSGSGSSSSSVDAGEDGSLKQCEDDCITTNCVSSDETCIDQCNTNCIDGS